MGGGSISAGIVARKAPNNCLWLVGPCGVHVPRAGREAIDRPPTLKDRGQQRAGENGLDHEQHGAVAIDPVHAADQGRLAQQLDDGVFARGKGGGVRLSGGQFALHEALAETEEGGDHAHPEQCALDLGEQPRMPGELVRRGPAMRLGDVATAVGERPARDVVVTAESARHDMIDGRLPLAQIAGADQEDGARNG